MEGERKNNNKRWYFTREQLENSPSRRFGLDPDKELSYRQQAANLLQDMGQRLNVSQLTINTAIVYMHRFYMIQSFTQFHRNLLVTTKLLSSVSMDLPILDISIYSFKTRYIECFDTNLINNLILNGKPAFTSRGFLNR
uniref:Cyclin T1 n=1 Tax=Equus caballus TaxID=9796 RepID=A0A9L0S257_HORSE